MIQDTSIKSYREDALPTLAQRHAEVMKALLRLNEATNSELANELGWTINRVTPRVHELRKLGKISEVGKRPCKITGRTAYVWTVKQEQLSLI